MIYYSYLIFIIVIILLLIIGIVRNVRKEESISYNDSTNTEDKTILESDSIDIEDFDKLFFEETGKGEKYQHFLSLSSQKDCAIIRGLLQADNIPSYTEGEHMNSIYGGISGTMNAVVAIRLHILYKDYDRAWEIVKEYMSSKIERIKSDTERSAGRKALDIISTFTCTPGTSAHEFLGIVVLPKAKIDDLLEECE